MWVGSTLAGIGIGVLEGYEGKGEGGGGGGWRTVLGWSV